MKMPKGQLITFIKVVKCWLSRPQKLLSTKQAQSIYFQTLHHVVLYVSGTRIYVISIQGIEGDVGASTASLILFKLVSKVSMLVRPLKRMQKA